MAGIYIHIPFCRKACNYCNFHFSTSLGHKSELIETIRQEIKMQKDFFRNNESTIETIYIGGGTPSLLSYEEISRIFDTLAEHFDLGALRECTLEGNPDDLHTQYIRQLRKSPVNRFSIGVQSFFDKDLSYMNRAHNAQQADYAIKAAQDAGFDALSIDLIYGTPGLSNEAWTENLGKMVSYNIPHFSAYALTVEKGTALEYQIRTHKQKPVNQEQAARQLEILMNLAPQLGYEQYEISNLASGNRYAIHNTNYWKGIPYLGIGPAAHSFDGESRYSNIANNIRYIKSILEDRRIPFEKEELSIEQRCNEYLMTSLRTKWGCDLDHIEKTGGADARKAVLANMAMLEDSSWLSVSNNHIYLNNNGKLLADHITASLFL